MHKPFWLPYPAVVPRNINFDAAPEGAVRIAARSERIEPLERIVGEEPWKEGRKKTLI